MPRRRPARCRERGARPLGGDRDQPWEAGRTGRSARRDRTWVDVGRGMHDRPELTADEREAYAWQMTVPGVGEVGQRKLKAASVLVSRVGGLGGVAAYELAAAGVGRLILAHAGNVKPGDLNRQLLMTHDAIGTSRVE